MMIYVIASRTVSSIRPQAAYIREMKCRNVHAFLLICTQYFGFYISYCGSEVLEYASLGFTFGSKIFDRHLHYGMILVNCLTYRHGELLSISYSVICVYSERVYIKRMPHADLAAARFSKADCGRMVESCFNLSVRVV